MVTREQLYEAVWSEPLIKLAERFQVSGNYLARVCDSLRVPRPVGGYWAKKAIGKASPKPPLPAVENGEPTQWSRGNGVFIRGSGPRNQPVQNKQSERKKTHALLNGAVAHFTHCRTLEAEKYLKPYKRNLVDITCSQTGLRHALAFANALFLALESKGYPVVLFGGQDGALRRPPIDPLDGSARRSQHNPHRDLWSPRRFTVAHVNGQMVGLSIVEVAEATVMRYVGNSTYVRDSEYVAPKTRTGYNPDWTWTTVIERPSGRLRLQAYVPHHRVDLAQQWLETSGSALTDRVPKIVSDIDVMAEKIDALVAQAKRDDDSERRKREAEWRRYEIKENKRRIRESIKESREQLDSIIRFWSETRARFDFLTGLGEEIAMLPESERESIQTRVNLAREILGPSDPMSHFRAWRSPAERYVPKHFEEQEEE